MIRLGSLDRFSAFGFESYLGELKQMMTSSKAPLSSAYKRLIEMEIAGAPEQFLTATNYLVPRIESSGPLPRGFNCEGYKQYSEICLWQGLISKKSPDNCIQLSFPTARRSTCHGFVRNILVNVKTGDISFVVKVYQGSDPFFHPGVIDCSFLDIFEIYDPAIGYEIVPLSNILYKCISLPRIQRFVVFPFRP